MLISCLIIIPFHHTHSLSLSHPFTPGGPTRLSVVGSPPTRALPSPTLFPDASDTQKRPRRHAFRRVALCLDLVIASSSNAPEPGLQRIRHPLPSCFVPVHVRTRVVWEGVMRSSVISSFITIIMRPSPSVLPPLRCIPSSCNPRSF
jgi:hypothetical protein